MLIQPANHFQAPSNAGPEAVYHQDCHAKSKCKEPYYFTSLKAISSEDAKILRSALMATKFYQKPERYLLHMNTSCVESCHRVQNIYRSKEVVYTAEEYASRINLSVLHWNENINGKYEDGKLVNGVEYTKSAKGTIKKKVATRNFMEGIVNDYFNEITS